MGDEEDLPLHVRIARNFLKAKHAVICPVCHDQNPRDEIKEPLGPPKELVIFIACLHCGFIRMFNYNFILEWYANEPGH